jgi:hypothetical protein
MNFVLYHIKFPHIYNIYDDNTMVYIDLWEFTNDPFYLVYNSAEQEYPVSPIFHFQRPIRSNWPVIFGVTFSSGEAPWNLEAHLDGPEAQKWSRGAPKHVGRGPHPLSTVQFTWFFHPPTFFDLKITIYGPKELSIWRAPQRIETRNRCCSDKDGGGNSTRITAWHGYAISGPKRWYPWYKAQERIEEGPWRSLEESKEILLEKLSPYRVNRHVL